MGRFFKLKQGPRSLHALGEWTQRECGRGRVRLYDVYVYHVCTMGQWPAENSFFVASFGPIGRRVPAGGWAVGRLVGRCSWAGLPPTS